MKILIWPDPRLKIVSEPVTEPLDPHLLLDMYETMNEAGGVGLSAIQIGLPKQFFLYGFKSYINPVIKTYLCEQKLMNEGCLSLPGQFESVKRFTKLEVSYWDSCLIEEHTETIEGLEAHVFQHEYEHLNGMLFVDKLPAARRSTIRGNLQKLKKSGVI